jgi:hypothetical protein
MKKAILLRTAMITRVAAAEKAWRFGPEAGGFTCGKMDRPRLLACP